MGLPATLNAVDAEAAFADCAADFANGSYAPGLELVVPIAQQAVRNNFTSSAGPDNLGWPPRKVAGDGHPLLMDRGNLLQAATGGGGGHIARVFDQHGEVGVDLSVVPYARAHNLGNPRQNLPQREFLGMREDREKEAAETLADWTLANKF